MDVIGELGKYVDKYGVGLVLFVFIVVLIIVMVHVWLGYTRTLNFWVVVFLVLEAILVGDDIVIFYLIGMAYSYLEEGDVFKFVAIMAFISIDVFLTVVIKALKKKYRL